MIGHIDTVHSPDDDAAPGYPVGAVAERLGVPTPTLRSWAQRYGIGPRAHRRGRHRLYTESDIAVLERMVALIRGGASAASAADAVRPTHPQPTRSRPPRRALQAIVAAADRLDTSALVALVGDSVRRHGVVGTWNSLCRPAFRAIEDRQESDGGCVDVEHALSWAVAAGLRGVATTGTEGDRISAVLACTPHEFHALPLEALRAALAEHGAAVFMLGPDVPATALADALRRTRPTAVVLWSHAVETADRGALAAALATSTTVFAAGPGWRRGELPDAVLTIDDLDDGLQRLLG